MDLPRRALRCALILLAAATLSGGAQEPQLGFHGTHQAMGTEYRLDLYAPTEARAEELMDLAFEEIDRLDALLSNYRPASELSRISREAPLRPVTTDPETFRLLERAQLWSRRSGGAFDLTVGPLLRTWGFFRDRGAIPSAAGLARARADVGWQHLHLDPATRTVRSAPRRRLELDPGSIGKGFAVDRVIELLRAQGVTAAFLSAGGSTLYGLGAPPGTAGWPVEIPNPLASAPTAANSAAPQTSRTIHLLLRDESLSTGACTEKFFVVRGHRFCHIFDPRSGRPVEGMLQTTVIDPSATDSDALSTVIFVLPPSESRRLLATLPHTRALLFRSPGRDPACIAIHWSGDVCGQPAAPVPNATSSSTVPPPTSPSIAIPAAHAAQNQPRPPQ